MRKKLGELRPGGVNVSEPGKSICLGVSVYAAKDSNGRIRIQVTDGGDLRISVTDQRNPRGIHAVLFRSLRRRLRENGAWAFGDERGETESHD